MKTIKQILLATTLTLVAISCKNDKANTNDKATTTENVAKQNTKKLVTNPQTASFEIEGMTCQVGCANLIEGKINKLDGVTDAKVDFETKTATVTYDGDQLNQEKLTKTVEDIADGKLYKVTKVKL
jgi:copper chaperone CopZ